MRFLNWAASLAQPGSSGNGAENLMQISLVGLALQMVLGLGLLAMYLPGTCLAALYYNFYPAQGTRHAFPWR